MAELHGDLFSRHACRLEGAGGFCVVSRKRPEETGYEVVLAVSITTNTPSPRDQSVSGERGFQQRTKTPMTMKEYRNEVDRKQIAPGYLPKWILLQDWLLQY